ncbi:MAG: hypothetical protein J7513_12865 [Solirubrobacteraceae bacterium]|nr:hypothetical protein [Solirubrobacteraceae bacterium]
MPSALSSDEPPTISAGAGVVAWSQPTQSGRWGLRVGTSAKGDLGHTFDAQPWPVDVSVGALRGEPEIFWSHCPKTSKAVARRVADGCDVVRLRDLAANAPMVRFPGASSRTFSETAPSRNGNRLVFARRSRDSSRAFAILRDIDHHTNRTLAGGPTGTCPTLARCEESGFLSAGPDELSIDGVRWAMRWRTYGGDDRIGISDNDRVLGGRIFGTTSKVLTTGATGLISGTCSERRFGSVQQIGTVVQSVRHLFDCDSTPPTGSDVVLRTSSTRDSAIYADPAHRRIVAAAADGGRLWLVREVRAYDYASSPERPGYCAEEVGGCDIVAVDEPSFAPEA